MVWEDMEEFEALLAPYIKEKMFTHSFAEIGHLEAANPIFSHHVYPDDRRIFDLASLTKALSTTPLIHNYLKSHKLGFETLVGDFPGTQDLSVPLKDLSIQSLLEHRSGLPAWRNFYVNVAGETNYIKPRLIKRLNHASLAINPKKPELYSDVGFLLLGFLLEQAVGKPLAQQFEEFCVTKLHKAPSLFPLGYQSQLESLDLPKNSVPTSFCAIRKRMLCGEVHDENAFALGGACSHAGLFSTGPGLVSFLKSLWSHPDSHGMVSAQLNGIKDPPKSSNMTGSVGNGSLLGWRQGADPSSELFARGLSAGHMGFTGTAFWITRDRYYGIFLTNRICSGRVNLQFKQVRRTVFEFLGRQIPSD
jgi:CubicO group peptidase (beta-lactamase class C family)